MMDGPVRWSDDEHDVMRGDLTAAAAYLTPAGGVVLNGVAPCGFARREDGTVGFTTSLGFAKKLERMIRDPHVALAYHARDHGFSSSPRFVLAQGIASIDLDPPAGRLEAFVPDAERHLGELRQGPVWDWILHEYYRERVFVDIAVTRLISWRDLGASGIPDVYGEPFPTTAAPQQPPGNGTAPRVDVDRVARQVSGLPHRLIGFRGGDGLPVVVPVEVAGHDRAGIRIVAPDRLLPAGGRRAGFLAHAYRPQLVGLRARTFTGWLDVGDDGTAVYAPHTSKGIAAPPLKPLLLVANGVLAKVGLAQARRKGVLTSLQRLQAERSPR